MKLGRREDRSGSVTNGLALVIRFGRVNARAYAAILRSIVAERLWRVPARTATGAGRRSA